MKTFDDYTFDQQSDFYLFQQTKFDLDVVNHFFNRLLDSRNVKDEVEFHNNLVSARSVLDVIIRDINSYENESTEPTEENS